MRFILLIFRYCHPTNRRKPQPGRGQPCPTPQPHIHQYLPHLRPRQLGRSIIDLIHNKAQVTVPFPTLLHHINRQDIQVFLSVATRPDRWKASITGYRASVRIILVLFHWGPCILIIRTRKRRFCGCGSLE